MSDRHTVAPQGTALTEGELRALMARDRAENDEEAARLLGVTVNTLRSQLSNARSRLGVRSTHRAIQIALDSQHLVGDEAVTHS